MGAEAARLGHLPILAAAYAKVGRVEEGLGVLAKALALVDKNGERYYEAELYRLKGELSLQSKQVETSQDKSEVKTNPEAEAEECFYKAIEVARRQSAKSLELRAVMSLSRLGRDRARRTKPGNCQRRSTTGSPKGLTHQICKRRKRCGRVRLKQGVRK